MLLHLLRLLPGAWTYQCTYFEMNASWRGTATLSSGRASATKSEIFPSYFHMRRHDEWRPCVWRLCASAAWQTNRNKKKKRNNNKYVGTRNTVFIHVYVCVCMCVCVCCRRIAKAFRTKGFVAGGKMSRRPIENMAAALFVCMKMKKRIYFVRMRNAAFPAWFMQHERGKARRGISHFLRVPSW